MRVALISGARTVDDGAVKGTAAYVSSLAVALKELGHEIHVFRSEAARHSEYRRVNDIHYHMVSNDSRIMSSHSLCEAMLYYLTETQGVAGPFDVVHAHHRALLPVLDEMKANGHAKVYLSLHSDSGLAGRNGTIKDASWGLVATLNGIAASSRSLRDRISDRLALNPRWIQVMYPGIDQKKYSRWVDTRKVKQQAGFYADDRLILFVGELTRSLGPDLLLEATFEIVHEFPTVKLVLLGDGPMAPYLRERAKVLGIFHSVRFLGFPKEDQIIDLYNACDVVCVPARSGHADQTVLEAWSAGKPTIVSQSTAPEFLEPYTNGLTPKPEVAAIMQDILACLRDNRFATELGNQGWHTVNRELSWAAIARRYEGIYKQNGNGREAL